MSSQDGPIVLVTGASSGIGRALCELLLDRGASVLGVTRRPGNAGIYITWVNRGGGEDARTHR